MHRFERRRRRAAIALLGVMAMMGGVVAPATQVHAATPVYVAANWHRGSTAFTQDVCSYFGFPVAYPSYCTVTMSSVDYRSLNGDPLTAPKVGEKFMVHAYTAVVAPDSLQIISGFQMRFLLPDGVQPVLTNAATEVRCLFTTVDDIQVGTSPCGLTKSGIYWQFPAGNLVNGRVLHYFFPVVATKPLPATATSDCSKAAVIDTGVCLQATSTRLINPHNVLPNPMVSWVAVRVVGTTKPTAPRTVTAGSRNAAAAVAWKAPTSNGGATITKYTVTAAPGGRTCVTAGTLSCKVTGLTNGVNYTFTVRATNAVGTSVASAASAAVKVGTPTPPRSPTITHPAAGVAKIAWLAPAYTGSGPVTRYEIRARATANGTTFTAWSAWTNLGLVASTRQTGLPAPLYYDIQLRAVNATGAGAPLAFAFLQSS